MHTRQDGRALVTVSPDSAAVLNGEVDISQWDDEELLYGRRRDRNGRFTGKPPRVVPVQFFNEFKRRQIFGADSELTQALPEAAQYLAAVATGKETAQPARLRACEMLLDRGLGKPVDRIQMSARVDMELQEPLWMQVMRRAVMVDGVPVGEMPEVQRAMGYPGAIPATASSTTDAIIDAEIIERDDDPILWEDGDDDPVLTDD